MASMARARTALRISLWIGAALFAFLISPRRPQAARRDGYLPPNNLKIPIRSVGSLDDQTGLTQDQYNQVLDRVQAAYADIVAAKGGQLVIKRAWDDPTVNAFASRDGNQYIIEMDGGFARYPEMTQDSLANVACHEMGHHLGGAPKSSVTGGGWASIEGQADYFANLKCLRRVFSDSGSQGFTRPAEDDLLTRQSCAGSFADAREQTVCVRATMSGVAMTRIIAKITGTSAPSPETPDAAVVDKTDEEHPAPQCRLDTYFQASLCPRPTSAELSDTDPSAGACTRSQGFTVGMRPLCWYKPPKSESAQTSGNAPIATLSPGEQRPSILPMSRIFSALQNTAPWQGL